ncbi:MAG: DUF2062 domain-containing protein [Pseudorhodobacter sp.]|nr:DUF2062 domain-containing protein [Pseudorhodobacter sp.]
MVFKRRDRRSFWDTVQGWFWPRRGWSRSFHYVRHRVGRLPDRPHRIARGVAVGVFISFSPLFGLHLIGAAAIAWAIRGNVIAALLATFIGNPVSYPFIALGGMRLGHAMLGSSFDGGIRHSFWRSFAGATHDLRLNILAVFTDAPTHWASMATFFYEIFLPYLVGGTVLGVVAGVVAYYLTLPVISAYQHRRRLRLKERLEALRDKIAAKKSDDRHDKP